MAFRDPRKKHARTRKVSQLQYTRTLHANEASAQIEMGDPIPCWYKERLAVRGEAHLGKERNRRSGADCQLPNSMKTGSTLSSSQ